MVQRFDTIWHKTKTELVTMAVDAGLGSWSAMEALSKTELQQFLKRFRDQQKTSTEAPSMPKNMDKLTNDKLKAYMQELGLTVPENYRKADLLFAIREYYEAKTREAATAEEWTEWTDLINQAGEADDLMTWYEEQPARASPGPKAKE